MNLTFPLLKPAKKTNLATIIKKVLPVEVSRTVLTCQNNLTKFRTYTSIGLLSCENFIFLRYSFKLFTADCYHLFGFKAILVTEEALPPTE